MQECNKHGLADKLISGTASKEHQAALTWLQACQLKGEYVVQLVPKASSLLVGRAKLAMMFGIRGLAGDTADYLVLLLP